MESSVSSGQTVAQFNLDNGLGELAQWFGVAEVERKNGGQVGTNSAPMAEYLLSYLCLSDGEAVELDAYFDREIQLKDVFRITTDSGILKVVKESKPWRQTGMDKGLEVDLPLLWGLDRGVDDLL